MVAQQKERCDCIIVNCECGQRTILACASVSGAALKPDVDPGPRQTVPNRFRRRKNKLLAEPLGPSKARASPDCSSMFDSPQRESANRCCGSTVSFSVCLAIVFRHKNHETRSRSLV